MNNEELNGRLATLIRLASTPSKNTKELSQTVSALALVVVDMHLEVQRMAGRRRDFRTIFVDKVLAPLLVGGTLWLFLDLGPAILSLVTP